MARIGVASIQGLVVTLVVHTERSVWVDVTKRISGSFRLWRDGYRLRRELMINSSLQETYHSGVMTMKTLLSASAALLALSLTVPAKAADMPVKYVAPAPVFTWTGCYVGVHIGYKWGKSRQAYGGLVNGVPNNFLPVGSDMTGYYNSMVRSAAPRAAVTTRPAPGYGASRLTAAGRRRAASPVLRRGDRTRPQPELPIHHQRALARHRSRSRRLGRRQLAVVRDRRRRLVRLRPQQL